MSSHDADATLTIVFFEEGIECQVNTMVMKRPRQRLDDIVGVLAQRQVVLVNPIVIAVDIRCFVGLFIRGGLVAFVEVGGRIEPVPCYIVGHGIEPFLQALHSLHVFVANHSISFIIFVV